MRRRFFLGLTAGLLACPAFAEAPPPLGASPQSGTPGPLKPSDVLGAAGDAAFLDWLNGFYAREAADGVSAAVLAQTLNGLAPDPRVVARNAAQPEFVLPISDYLARNITPGVIALGKARRDGVGALAKIVETYGAPPDILTAIWGMESGFGANEGDMDVVRSLATLAAEAPGRRAWAESELEACLKIVATGAAARGQLKGSWAGAMGQTQLLPSAFLDTAVTPTGAGRPDIWGSAADALASAANLLAKSGWRRFEGWAAEVALGPKFDLSLSEGPKQPPAWWESQGARRADGQAWSKADSEAVAQLLLPAGADGPAFLVFPNHFVIRSYNNSLAYALSIGLLADRLAGGGPLARAWPKEVALSLEDRMAAQSALARLGYDPGPPDGLIGVGTRQALRSWQKDQRLPADGYLTPALVARLKTAAKPGVAPSA